MLKIQKVLLKIQKVLLKIQKVLLKIQKFLLKIQKVLPTPEVYLNLHLYEHFQHLNYKFEF